MHAKLKYNNKLYFIDVYDEVVVGRFNDEHRMACGHLFEVVLVCAKGRNAGWYWMLCHAYAVGAVVIGFSYVNCRGSCLASAGPTQVGRAP